MLTLLLATAVTGDDIQLVIGYIVAAVEAGALAYVGIRKLIKKIREMLKDE